MMICVKEVAEPGAELLLILPVRNLGTVRYGFHMHYRRMRLRVALWDTKSVDVIESRLYLP